MAPLPPFLTKLGLQTTPLPAGNLALDAFKGLIVKDSYWRWPVKTKPTSALQHLNWQGSAMKPKLAGHVFGRRGWRGMKVILPNGQVGNMYRAVRGLVVVRWTDEFALRPDQCIAINVEELQPFKVPAAVVLGTAKTGVKSARAF